MVVADSRLTLQKCAFVENYLGFPAGIEPRLLLDLGERSLVADRLLAAFWSDSDYLDDLGVHTATESAGSVSVVPNGGDMSSGRESICRPCSSVNHPSSFATALSPTVRADRSQSA